MRRVLILSSPACRQSEIFLEIRKQNSLRVLPELFDKNGQYLINQHIRSDIELAFEYFDIVNITLDVNSIHDPRITKYAEVSSKVYILYRGYKHVESIILAMQSTGGNTCRMTTDHYNNSVKQLHTISKALFTFNHDHAVECTDIYDLRNTFGIVVEPEKKIDQEITIGQ